MFRGEHALNMDDKGRVAVPAKYRERLEEEGVGKLVVTVSLMERCLVAYPFPEWQRVESDLVRLPSLKKEVQIIKHLLLGQAIECTLDRPGRILLPQPLRDFAGIGRRLRMVGQGRNFELWDEEAWTGRREEYLQQVGALDTGPESVLASLML